LNVRRQPPPPGESIVAFPPKRDSSRARRTEQDTQPDASVSAVHARDIRLTRSASTGSPTELALLSSQAALARPARPLPCQEQQSRRESAHRTPSRELWRSPYFGTPKRRGMRLNMNGERIDTPALTVGNADRFVWREASNASRFLLISSKLLSVGTGRGSARSRRPFPVVRNAR